MASRLSVIKRETKETNISLELNIDGSGKYDINTGIIATNITAANPSPTRIHHNLNPLKYRIIGFRFNQMCIMTRTVKIKELMT